MSTPNTAIIYTQPNCAGCVSAKTLLRSKGYTILEKDITFSNFKEELFNTFPGVRSVPQIIVNSAPIGDLNALKKFFAQ